MDTTVDVLTVPTEWLDEWERLFALTPKKVWKKKEIERKDGESNYHFSYRLMYSFLVKKAMRELGQRRRYRDSGEQQLGRHLLHHLIPAMKYAHERGGFDLGRKYAHYSPAAFEAQMIGMCTRAAGWALNNFDPETYKKKQEIGRRGGMAYRTWDLQEYMDTYDMSANKAAATLQVHRNTITNMRKHFDKIFDMNTGEVFDEDGL